MQNGYIESFNGRMRDELIKKACFSISTRPCRRQPSPRIGAHHPYVRTMAESPEHLRLRAEACRRLAELAGDAERRELWLNRAAEWDRQAVKASRRIGGGEKPRVVGKRPQPRLRRSGKQ